MRRNRVLFLGLIAFGALLMMAGPAVSGDDESKCTAAKLKAAGKYDKCVFKAVAKGEVKGEDPDGSKCDLKFLDKWDRSDLKYGSACLPVGSSLDALDELKDLTDIFIDSTLSVVETRDLVIVDPDYRVDPGTGQFVVTVRNDGTKPINNTRVAVQGSDKFGTGITCSSKSLTPGINNQLEAGETLTYTFDEDRDPCAGADICDDPAHCRFTIIADPDDILDEGPGEANNEEVVRIGVAPNLLAEPQFGGGPTGFCSTDDGDLVVEVENNGTDDADAFVTLVFFDTVITVGDPPISLPLPIPVAVGVDGVAAGTSVKKFFPIPPYCFVPDCHFHIFVDSGDQVEESNEGDNTEDDKCIG